MKLNLKHFFFLAVALIAVATSCNKDNKPTPVATTPLYDTLGWFIQGANGKVEGNGTKMIADPEHPGVEIQAGRLAIRTVVDKAIQVIAADPELQPYFPVLLAEVNAGNTTGYSRLLESFTDFVQQRVSGQQVYKGRSMVEAHNHASYNRFGSDANPKADSSDFDQFVGDIVIAAQSLNVPNSVIGQLGTLLYATEGDVVQDK